MGLYDLGIAAVGWLLWGCFVSFSPQLQTSPEYGQGMNPISRLAQIQQAKKEKEPEYMLITERGLPRRREFVMQVCALSSAPHSHPLLATWCKTACQGFRCEVVRLTIICRSCLFGQSLQSSRQQKSQQNTMKQFLNRTFNMYSGSASHLQIRSNLSTWKMLNALAGRKAVQANVLG